MPFVDNSKKRKIDHTSDPRIKKGEWFIIRCELDWKQKRQLGLDKMLTIKTKSMFGGGDAIDNGMMQVDFQLAEAEHLRIQAYLLEWCVYDSQSDAFISPPISYENVGQLDEHTASVILALIKQMEGEADSETDLVDNPLSLNSFAILEGKSTRDGS